MHNPFSFENEHLHIRAFRPEDFAIYSSLVEEIYQLLSDDETLYFIPQKD